MLKVFVSISMHLLFAVILNFHGELERARTTESRGTGFNREFIRIIRLIVAPSMCEIQTRVLTEFSAIYE
jgi:hypothetical protein